MGSIRWVCRNVKYWRDAPMALRWTAAAMLEAANGFRRLKAHRQLPILKSALAAYGASHGVKPALVGGGGNPRIDGAGLLRVFYD